MTKKHYPIKYQLLFMFLAMTISYGSAGSPLAEIMSSKLMVSLNVAEEIDITCNGGNDGRIRVNTNGTGTPGFTYTITGQNSGFSQTWVNQAAGVNQAGLIADTYTITVEDSNGATDQVTVTLQEGKNISFSPTVKVVCAGGNSGSIKMGFVSGGNGGPFTYSWTGPNGFSANTKNIFNLAAGNYTYLITDRLDCEYSNTMTVAEFPMITANFTIAGDICDGGTNNSVTVTAGGGLPNYTFAWADDNTITTPSRTGLATGTYTVFITDANNCTIAADVPLNEPVQLSLNQAQNILCNGSQTGKIWTKPNGTGTPPYDYHWESSNGQAYDETTNGGLRLSGLAAGTYNITVTDANGCTDTFSHTLTEPGPIVFNPAMPTVNNVECAGEDNGSIQIGNVTGGNGVPFTFNWTGPNGFTTNTKNISGLAPGDYTYIFADNLGCQVTATYTITEQNVPAPTAVTQEIEINQGETMTIPFEADCAGDNVFWYSAASGGPLYAIGYTYTPAGTSNLPVGTYFYYAECQTNDGCSSPSRVPFQLTVLPNYSITGNIASCNNTSIPQVYINLSGDATSDAITDLVDNYSFTNLETGNYTVTPSKQNSMVGDGLTGFDMLLIQRHIQGDSIITDPCQLIAADVSRDCNLTALDILYIKNIIQGYWTDFPSGDDWRFVPENYSFPQGVFPCGYPESIDYSPLQQDETNQNFIGIKLGDVNGSGN